MPDLSRRSFMLRQLNRRKCTCVAVIVLGFALIITLLAFLCLGAEDSGNGNLKDLQQVSILFRHGDRTPTETYPNDPYKAPSVWPEGYGALTKVGMMQMFTLGEYIRKRYGAFLSEIYTPDETLVTSSDHDRCLMSAETHLAGLYPPEGWQKWHPELNWQPIPIHATPRLLDKLIVVKKPCPKYEKELIEAYNSPEITQLNNENKELYAYLSKHSGKDINNITAVESLYNTLEIEESYKLTLPEWTKSVYPEKMKLLAAMSLAIFTHTESMKRSKGGPLVKDISEHMVGKRSGVLKPDRKLFIYSAHDLTIVNVWRTLGFTEFLKPEYGATLLFEMHTVNQGTDHEVKILYLNNTQTTRPIALTVPGCEKPCLLDNFLTLIKDVVPVNWDKECKLT